VRLETARLTLRPFGEQDRAPFAAMNADPEVMRFFPATLTRAQSDAGIDRWNAGLSINGFQFLAMETRLDRQFAGVIGLAALDDDLRAAIPGSPRVEIGWRLPRIMWGMGLAPEGAAACLEFAWVGPCLSEVVALTCTGNAPSRRVMEKLGMTRDRNDDFGHPRLPAEHPLRPHVLYRIANPRLLQPHRDEPPRPAGISDPE